MSVDVLSKDYICKWLRHPPIPRDTFSRHVGMPINVAQWLAFKPETAHMSPMRQRMISRAITEIENGDLVFVQTGGNKLRPRGYLERAKKAARPIARFGVKVGERGAELVRHVPPPKITPMLGFPSLGALTGFKSKD